MSAAAESLQSCLTLRRRRQQPTRLLCPWGSPGKNTGVGCHFLLQCMHAYMHAKLLQSCLTLCDPMDSSPLGSPVHGILQARILQWVAVSSSNACMRVKSLQLYPTLCNPMDSGPPGSPVHGILQARILEWLAISFSMCLNS